MMHAWENRYMNKTVVVKTTGYFWTDKCKQCDNERSQQEMSERINRLTWFRMGSNLDLCKQRNKP